LSLARHRVEPGCVDVRIAERAEVAVPHVVGEDDDDVRRLSLRVWRPRTKAD
jgi:hypothetical protein